jgi:tyrosine-specific transport protein
MHIIRGVGQVLGGTLLIAATTIGVGMLGLPIATGSAGFMPSMIIYFLTWGFMLCTGLLFLEICTWMPKEANLITMAHRLLGSVGKGVCWVVYLFLFFTAMIAHVSAGGSTLVDICLGFHVAVPLWLAMVLYVLIFAPVVYLGTRVVNRFNSFMMIGVLITYCLFILLSWGKLDFSLLAFTNWKEAWKAFPVLFTAFTYQLIIPTLMTYMNRNVKKVRLSIILGSSIPLAIYLIWEMVILGIIPACDLIRAKEAGETAIMPLRSLLGNSWIFVIGNYFAFFVLTTSYIALALAFIDFLADGLGVKKIGMRKLGLCAGIFVPPLIIALVYPGIFIVALEYVGGVSCAFLFGFLPPLMVWIGRYVKKYSGSRDRLLFGGKVVLFILMVFVGLEFVLQIMNKIESFKNF